MEIRQESKKQPMFMTSSEVSELLKIAPQTLDAWVKAGKFPAPVRLGFAKRWLRADIFDYVTKKLLDAWKDSNRLPQCETLPDGRNLWKFHSATDYLFFKTLLEKIDSQDDIILIK